MKKPRTCVECGCDLPDDYEDDEDMCDDCAMFEGEEDDEDEET